MMQVQKALLVLSCVGLCSSLHARQLQRCCSSLLSRCSNPGFRRHFEVTINFASPRSSLFIQPLHSHRDIAPSATTHFDVSTDDKSPLARFLQLVLSSRLVASATTAILGAAIRILLSLTNALRSCLSYFQNLGPDNGIAVSDGYDASNIDTDTSTVGGLQQVIGGDNVTIRPATDADTKLVLDFIRELASFEQLEDQVTATAETLHSKLFPPSPYAPRPRVLILEVNGASAGFVLYFFNFSTFVGKNGVYIEDLYVREPYRGRGLGKLLLKRICQVARDNDCGRVEWWCLDWNQKAIDFYLKLGAEQMVDWTVYRLDRSKIESIAGSS
jgi:GNAT superfamily N-acetyltransferase